MAIMIICLLVVMVMPFIAKIPLAIEMNKLGGYDNKHPRAQQSQLTGLGARALAAHKNCFEALTYFVPAVVTVIALGAIDETAKWLAVVFVFSRVVYLAMYWANADKLRSMFWLIGIGCALTLLIRLLLAFG